MVLKKNLGKEVEELLPPFYKNLCFQYQGHPQTYNKYIDRSNKSLVLRRKFTLTLFDLVNFHFSKPKKNYFWFFCGFMFLTEVGDKLLERLVSFLEDVFSILFHLKINVKFVNFCEKYSHVLSQNVNFYNYIKVFDLCSYM